MEQVEIIMLQGVAGVGKDEVGLELVKNGFIRISFADAAKLELSKKLNIPLEYLTKQGPNKEKYREVLIRYAENERKKNKFCWIERAIKPYLSKETYLKPGRYVITDFRRDSEIEWYKDLRKKNINIKIFLIERPGVRDNDILTLQTLAKTIRENLIEGTINNNSTIEELRKKIYKQILKK